MEKPKSSVELLKWILENDKEAVDRAFERVSKMKFEGPTIQQYMDKFMPGWDDEEGFEFSEFDSEVSSDFSIKLPILQQNKVFKNPSVFIDKFRSLSNNYLQEFITQSSYNKAIQFYGYI